MIYPNVLKPRQISVIIYLYGTLVTEFMISEQ